ncbi:MAG TPA: acyl-CoA dehydrogenase family protein [Acidimicrobiales bacterium]|nr:acyl-CoA dehydrogenase family protein [Acidimicrobiales bacterium]
MDFDFTEEQLAVAEAAAAIFEGMAGAERVAEIEDTEDRFDAALWSELARANLLGLAVPEGHGGSGLGLIELCLVLEQQGRAVAPVPLWATLVLGALPVARFGTPEQQARWLPAVAAGEVRLTAALNEVAASRHNHPTVRAEPDGEGWRLHGTAFAVPQAHLAARVLVPAARHGDPGAGTVVALVDPGAEGVRLERATTTDHQIHPHLHLDGVPVGAADVVAGPEQGATVVPWMLDRARTGLCAVQLGVTEEAVRRAAAYLNQRHQFGRPLSSFQGTMLRAADAYIDTEAIRVTTWQAAWRIDEQLPASEAVAVAHWWASEAGQRVVHATQHLHGGLGADISYPIHRYFLWGKQIELMLQGPSAELARLGAMVATRLRTSSSMGGTVTGVEGP